MIVGNTLRRAMLVEGQREDIDGLGGGKSDLAFSAYASDPLGHILFDRLHLSPLGVAVLSVLAALPFGGLALLLSTAPPLSKSFNEAFGPYEWPSAVFLVVMLPVMGAFYAWVSRRSGSLAGQLFENRVFDADPQSFSRRVTGLQGTAYRLHSSNIWPRLSAVIISLTLVALWAPAQARDPWSPSDWIWSVFTLPVVLAGWYIVCMVAARQIATMQILWHLFRTERVRLQPLHPDKAGGLSPMGEYTMGFGYFVGAVGFGLVGLALQALVRDDLGQDYATFAAIAVCAVLGPIIFFGTLGAAHGVMRDTKRRWLADISAEFDNEYGQTLGTLSSERQAFNGRVERIRGLKRLHELTQDFPVWPFDAGTIRRFAAVLSAPLLTLALTQLAEALLRD